MENEEGHVHEQNFIIKWVPHFCQKCEVIGRMCDESRQGLKNRHVVKVVKKSTLSK